MNKQLIKTFGLAITLSVLAQTSNAAVIKNAPIKPIEKNLQMAKALDQQKRKLSTVSATDNELKMINAIRNAPAQNFFAAQHQSFSRFVQSILLSHNS